MLPARRAARALRGLRPAKPAPVSRAKSQVWAGNDAWRRAPPTSRSFSDKNPLEPEVLAEPAPVSAEALDRARTDTARVTYRTRTVVELAVRSILWRPKEGYGWLLCHRKRFKLAYY